MKLTVLCDNNTYIDNYLLGEPALSFFIKNENDKILFDLGYSDVWKQNAKKMDIDINKINKICLSHGHDDHTRGIKYFPKNINPVVYYTQGCFEEKWSDSIEISSPYSLKKMKQLFKTIEVTSPVEISKNLFYLGKIPRKIDFENNKTTGLYRKVNEKLIQDEMEDDTALVYNSNNGLYIMTGCSHSGICNICDYATNLFKKEIKMVIGGFHLLKLDNRATQSIKVLKQYKNAVFYPSHCTSLKVKSEMIRQGLNVVEVGSGLKLEFN